MKPILLGLLILSSIAVTALFVPKMTGATLAVAAPNTGSVSSGLFYPSVDPNPDPNPNPNPNRVAALRFEFTLAQNVLLNLAGSSEISFLNPFTGKAVTLEVLKGEPYPSAPKDYLQRVEPIALKLEIPKNVKAGVYNVKLNAQMFLCEAVLKVCYLEDTPGSFEIRVGQTGRDTPVKLEYVRPQR